MDARLFLSTLRARFAIFSVTLIVTVLVATALSLLWPKSYLATASLVVDSRNEQSLSDPLNALASARERVGYMQTQVDILTSPKVALRVVNDLHLADAPETRDDYAKMAQKYGSIEEWLAEVLRRNVEVTTSQSSVLEVSYPARSPVSAAAIANGFAKAYMDTMLDLRVEPTKQAAVWFDEQLKTLRGDLEAAQAKATEFQRAHGIVSADERLDVEQQRLTELSTQLLEAEQHTLTMRARERAIADAVARGAPVDQIPGVETDDQIVRMKMELVAGEAKLETLATQYGDRYPEYRRQLADNANRRRALAAEYRKSVDKARSLREEGERHESDVRAALNAQRARLLDLRTGRDQLGVLTGNVDTAQRAYDAALQRYVVSQVESRASQTNVSLLNAAAVPPEPYRPKIALNILLSIVVGTLLGVAFAVVRELTDRHVRTVADLDCGLDIPQLGAISAWRRPAPLLLPGARPIDDPKLLLGS
jgi:polysaccharide biosynthesis transport protein